MANIIINHSGSQTIIDNNGTAIEFATADATVTATSDTRISIVVDEIEELECSIYDIVSIDGAKPYGNAEDVVTQITNESSGGGSSYSVYTALLTQSGTDAPVATVLENTLGGTVVWTRANTGNYTATLAGAFPEGRTVYFVSPLSSPQDISAIGRNDGDSLYFDVTSGGASSDNILYETSIEIRVYPAP